MSQTYSTSATTHMQAKTEVDAPTAAYSSRPLTTSLPVSSVSENSRITSRDTVVMTLKERRIFHVPTTSTSCAISGGASISGVTSVLAAVVGITSALT